MFSISFVLSISSTIYGFSYENDKTIPESQTTIVDPTIPAVKPRTAAETKLANEEKDLAVKIEDFYIKKYVTPAIKENLSIEESLKDLRNKLKLLNAKDSTLKKKLEQSILDLQNKLAINKLIISWIDPWKSGYESIYNRNYDGYSKAFFARQKIEKEHYELTKEAFPHPYGLFLAEQKKLEKAKKKLEKPTPTIK
jgi:hypothetical protein